MEINNLDGKTLATLEIQGGKAIFTTEEGEKIIVQADDSTDISFHVTEVVWPNKDEEKYLLDGQTVLSADFQQAPPQALGEDTDITHSAASLILYFEEEFLSVNWLSNEPTDEQVQIVFD